MKDKLRIYLETLTLTSNNLETLVDFKKTSENVLKFKKSLKELNYLIVNDEKEFEKRLSELFEKDNKIFDCLHVLVAVRDDKTLIEFLSEYIEIGKFKENIQTLLVFFKSTGLMYEILNGEITDFVQYVKGIEVGMDSNTRKNRTGTKREEYIYNLLKKRYKQYDNIEILEQVKIDVDNDELSNKIFDFLIVNKQNDKKLVIECSFYNAGGSKISETCRGYHDLFKTINEQTDYHFLWLADGNGMKTIKKQLSDFIDDDYIVNTSMLTNKIDTILLIK